MKIESVTITRAANGYIMTIGADRVFDHNEMLVFSECKDDYNHRDVLGWLKQNFGQQESAS
jgi:hypothetical protein